MCLCVFVLTIIHGFSVWRSGEILTLVFMILLYFYSLINQIAFEKGKVEGSEATPDAAMKMLKHGFDAVIKALFAQLTQIALKREKYTQIIFMENYYFFYVSIL